MAKSLLKEAGWEDTDGDNILEKAINGERIKLSFKLGYFSKIESYKGMAIMIKDYMEDVGFEVILDQHDPMELFGLAQMHDYDAVMLSIEGDASIENPLQLWSTDSWANHGYNFSGFGSARTDSLMRLCMTSMEPDKYDGLIKLLQKEVYLEQPFIFLYQPMKKMVISKKFTNADMYVEKAGIVLNNLKPVDMD